MDWGSFAVRDGSASYEFGSGDVYVLNKEFMLGARQVRGVDTVPSLITRTATPVLFGRSVKKTCWRPFDVNTTSNKVVVKGLKRVEARGMRTG